MFEVIYLDSAHLAGEVLLELEMAWRLLPQGGLLFGDDFSLPEVRQDVLKFTTIYQHSLDDGLGNDAWPHRTLARPRPGLFVSYRRHQWSAHRAVEDSVRERSRHDRTNCEQRTIDTQPVNDSLNI